ncbi:MAPEG family protein [Rhodobacteraceae bacterium CCMM004]|nr:MAPEG family protein [Rhodobacteraceae bacterium CCMM004]
MKRRGIALGMAAGAVWAVALVWLGVAVVDIPVFLLAPSLAFAFLGPGLVLAALIARFAARRFFDDALIDGAAPPPGSAAEVDLRVLRNTAEQLLLALCLWPPTAWLLVGDGPGVAVTLGVGFVVARAAFWIGYRTMPPLRAFGFAATFYPTLAAALWAGLHWML